MTATPPGGGGGPGGISILGSAARLHPSLPPKPTVVPPTEGAEAKTSSSAADARDVAREREYRRERERERERESYRGRELLATRQSDMRDSRGGAAADADPEHDRDRDQSQGRLRAPLASRLGSRRDEASIQAVHPARQDREARTPPFERTTRAGPGASASGARGDEWRDAPPHTGAYSHGNGDTPPYDRSDRGDRGDWGDRDRNQDRGRRSRYGSPQRPRERERDGRDTYRPHDTYRPGSSPARDGREAGDAAGTAAARDGSPGRRIGRDRDDDERARERASEPDAYGRDDRYRTRTYDGDNGTRFRSGPEEQARNDRDRRSHASPSLDPSGTSYRGRADLQQPLPPPPHAMPPYRPTLPAGSHRDRASAAGASHAAAGAVGGNAGHGGPPGNLNFEQRRQLRESTQVNIWPDSPKRPFAEIEKQDDKARRSKKDKDKSGSKSRRRRRYTSETDSESDSERERERERRRRKRRERERERERDRERKDDDGREKRRRRTETDDEREEKDKERKRDRERRRTSTSAPAERDARAKSPAAPIEAEDDGPEVGPQPPTQLQLKTDRGAYRDLLPGEGQAMAAFVQSGQRIPRRGEIGMDQAQIAALEDAGYVMSGSRHARMTAVRLRKEGQVMDAEEKRAHLLKQREEWVAKEGAIISQFKEMRDEQLKLEERKRRGEAEDKGKGRARD